jgi:hypothetical protein
MRRVLRWTNLFPVEDRPLLAEMLFKLWRCFVSPEFATPWRNYSLNEMDRFDLDGQVIYVAHDRTCVFIEHWDLAQSPTIHQANQYEIDDLWDKHRLVALLPVIKNLQSQAGQFTDRHIA